MSRGRIELINKETGEQINVFPGSIHILRSYENEYGSQVTLVEVANKEIEVDATYDSICYEFKKAGYDITSRMYYTDLKNDCH